MVLFSFFFATQAVAGDLFGDPGIQVFPGDIPTVLSRQYDDLDSFENEYTVCEDAKKNVAKITEIGEAKAKKHRKNRYKKEYAVFKKLNENSGAIQDALKDFSREYSAVLEPLEEEFREQAKSGCLEDPTKFNPRHAQALFTTACGKEREQLNNEINERVGIWINDGAGKRLRKRLEKAGVKFKRKIDINGQLARAPSSADHYQSDVYNWYFEISDPENLAIAVVLPTGGAKANLSSVYFGLNVDGVGSVQQVTATWLGLDPTSKNMPVTPIVGSAARMLHDKIASVSEESYIEARELDFRRSVFQVAMGYLVDPEVQDACAAVKGLQANASHGQAETRVATIVADDPLPREAPTSPSDADASVRSLFDDSESQRAL